ncbi:tRNA lysidine(34) synthetase TilS [Novispirillum sp. DQ9]|uniref:tRNA lysidine(34) synthetase TilS n=1 Tax=Novispirillum sp. DQ9 TaxID=3398612 RepID=UPI003C7E4249
MTLTDAAFAALMEPLGPFEAAPRLAVGVSGGADSLALVILADAWARARGGAVTALTVDHGLRPEAAAEAARVGSWMAGLGIAHAVLRPAAPLPGSNLQAEARAVRHHLLRGWCRDHGVLHLLLAHNLEDQAETLLLRLARGSGVAGLSAMAAVSWTAETRLLRPLLTVPRAALEALLAARGRDWVRDPSNANEAFGRVRMRRLLPVLGAEGATPRRLAGTARRLAATRVLVEEAVADLLAAAVAPHPAGFVVVDPQVLGAAPGEVAVRALRRILAVVGGTDFGPRAERAEAVLGRLGTGPATLGGCLLAPLRNGTLLVTRETRGLPRLVLPPGGRALWDGRFRVRLAATASRGEIAALGAAGWRQIAGEGSPTALAGLAALPAAARTVLPALWRDGRVAAVAIPGAPLRKAEMAVEWAPRQVLVSGAFRLAAAPSSII